MASREPKAICERIGGRIRERRKFLRLSLDALAKQTELSKAGLWEIEDGRNEPRAGTLLRLCRVLGLSADVLLGVNESDCSSDVRCSIACPDCGPVRIEGDTFEDGRPISGLCPECNERLYFM